MKKHILLILICSCIFLGFRIMDNEGIFQIKIEQNGELIPIINNEVTLSKSPFSFVCEFEEPMGILVNATFSNKTIIQAQNNKPLKKLQGFSTTAMADADFNIDKNIMLSEMSPNFWYYDSATSHRFNTIENIQRKIICKREITNFYNVDDNTTIPLSQVSTPLYVVFISAKWNNDFTKQFEFLRKTLTIHWKE